MDAAVWAELSLIEAIPAVFPHELMGVRPVRGVLGDQGDAHCPWPRVAIDLSKVQRAPWRRRNSSPNSPPPEGGGQAARGPESKPAGVSPLLTLRPSLGSWADLDGGVGLGGIRAPLARDTAG